MSSSALKLLASTKVNGIIPVFKYESERTGLKIVLAQVEGPLVNGYFTLATEAHDDDGLPHTLEHLIFLGSEQYPFKGVLDLLANRCLASGTNAWTDTDHTCYTMTTAGKDGFLELLPIYLDHVLYPTLSDAGFITEVHHVSGDGEDGGVVYCEMQGRENTGESLAHLNLMRLAYPGCGYSSETGGIMENLRTTTTNPKIRAYHAEFYRPENLTVIIAGQIGIDEVALAIEPIEQRIVGKKLAAAAAPVVPFVRPWQTPVEPLQQSQNVSVVFPSDEEDCGIVSVGWRGPLCNAENQVLTACSVLLRYLCDTAVSPLQREFVEVPDPYAAQISYSLCENLESFLYMTFESVPMEKIDAVPERLQEVLRAIVEGREAIDMVRMKSILERNVLEFLNSLEGNPHDAVSFLAIADALYGNTEEDFQQRLGYAKQLEQLLTKKEPFWRQLMKQYLIDGNSVIVRSAPSIEEQQRMAALENDRIDRQRCALGPDGLAAKATALAEATEENGRLPPNEMLTQVPIPSPDSIRFHPLVKWQGAEGGWAGGEHPAGFSLDALPCYAEAYDVHTNFVYMIVTLNTEQLTAAQRPLLFLLLDLLTESPVRRADGTLLPYEDVVTALERDTVSMGTYIGLESASQFSCGPFSDSCTLMLLVEPRKYALGVQWIIDLLQRTEFTAERIRVCASKITNAVSQAKRKGNAVVSELLKAMYYRSDSNVRSSSMLRQHKFLNALLERLELDADAIVGDLNAVREVITRPPNMAVHVAANWTRMQSLNVDLTGPWALLGGAKPPAQPEEKRLAVKMDYSLFQNAVVPQVAVGGDADAEEVQGNDRENEVDGVLELESSVLQQLQPVLEPLPESLGVQSHGTIVGMGCIESAFMYHATPSISSFSDPDLPVLMLFLQYLTQLEGPLWRQIRGQGFAYGYNLMVRPNEALLLFTLYRATNVVAAYKETKATVEAQLMADAVWDETLLASAKSSLIYEIIEREKSVGDLVVQALLGSFKRVPVGYNRDLVRRVNEVSVEDLRRVGEQHVAKLFGGGGEARTAIVCHPDKTTDVQEAFAQLGRNLTVDASLEESVLGQC